MKIGELFFTIGADTKDLEKSLQKGRDSLAKFSLEILATLYAIDRFVNRATSSGNAITNLSKASGIAAKELQSFGLAASLSNVGASAEDAEKQMAGFASNLYSLQNFGEGNALGYNKLELLGKGFSWVGLSALQARDKISKAIDGLNDQQAIDIIGSFGFGPEMLPVMRMSAEEYSKLAEKFVVSDKQLEALNELGLTVKQLKENLSFKATSFVAENKELFEGLAEMIEKFLESVSKIGSTANIASAAFVAAFAPMLAVLTALVKANDELTAAAEGRSTKFHEWITRNISNPIAKVAFPDKNNTIESFSAEIDKSRNGGGKSPVQEVQVVEPSPGSNAPAPSNAPTSTLGEIYNLSAEDAAKMQGKSFREIFGGGSSTTTVNNNNYIQGSDSKGIADHIVDQTQRQITDAHAQQNNGAVY